MLKKYVKKICLFFVLLLLSVSFYFVPLVSADTARSDLEKQLQISGRPWGGVVPVGDDRHENMGFTTIPYMIDEKSVS